MEWILSWMMIGHDIDKQLSDIRLSPIGGLAKMAIVANHAEKIGLSRVL
jgi:hypothetical protein